MPFVREIEEQWGESKIHVVNRFVDLYKSPHRYNLSKCNTITPLAAWILELD